MNADGTKTVFRQCYILNIKIHSQKFPNIFMFGTVLQIEVRKNYYFDTSHCHELPEVCN